MLGFISWTYLFTFANVAVNLILLFLRMAALIMFFACALKTFQYEPTSFIIAVSQKRGRIGQQHVGVGRGRVLTGHASDQAVGLYAYC